MYVYVCYVIYVWSELRYGCCFWCLPWRSNPPIAKKVSSFSIPGRCIPVLGTTFRLVSEPESLHVCSGCLDGPCSFLALADSPLPRRSASEEPASGAPQVTSPVSSALNNPPGLDSQLEEIRVDSNSGICLHQHTLPNRSGTNVSARGSVQRSGRHPLQVIRAKCVIARGFYDYFAFMQKKEYWGILFLC